MDQHIVCSDCGNSFLFSASEATVFADRGLASPKRCKDCRKARKDRGPSNRGDGGRQGGFAEARGGRRGNFGGGERQGHGFAGHHAGHHGGAPRRYTGDVNEYRSPMQDSPSAFQGSFHGHHQEPAGERRPRRIGAPRWTDDGNYRAPSSHGQEPRHGHGQPRARAASKPTTGPAPAPRKRPPAEMFSITCSSCGTTAEVPFKPVEGREVFCQPCYRARKPQ